MKKIISHVKKHHENLKSLDHKILEVIHGMELSLVLVFTIIGISFGFVLYLTDWDTSDVQVNPEISTEAMIESETWRRVNTEAKIESETWRRVNTEVRIESETWRRLEEVSAEKKSFWNMILDLL